MSNYVQRRNVLPTPRDRHSAAADPAVCPIMPQALLAAAFHGGRPAAFGPRCAVSRREIDAPSLAGSRWRTAAGAVAASGRSGAYPPRGVAHPSSPRRWGMGQAGRGGLAMGYTWSRPP
ncbi:MAG: hypothetical protein RQ839_01705 [Thermoproteus sp.]|nr:hypothetical protein [Thermoproteus sp.]MDT7880908.1 hypothetical protein [Thermoproteus sp.]